MKVCVCYSAVYDAAQMVYSLTYTDTPEGYDVTRATVDYSVIV